MHKMNFIIPIILQILGAVVIIAEFIVPSMGILTAIAVALTGYSLFLAFTTISSTAGFAFVALDIILFPVIVFIGIKLLAVSPASLKMTLKDIEKEGEELEYYTSLVGKTGTAVTNLSPCGIVLVEDSRIDVVSEGNFIEKQDKVKIVSVNGNRVVVEKAVD